MMVSHIRENGQIIRQYILHKNYILITVDHWDQIIASRLVILGKKNPNSSLESVSVTPETVNITWKVSR
jgi:hypothetical protein